MITVFFYQFWSNLRAGNVFFRLLYGWLAMAATAKTKNSTRNKRKPTNILFLTTSLLNDQSISTFFLDPPPPHLRLKSLFLYKYKFESSYQSICWTCYLTQTSTWHGKAVWLRGWTTGTIPTQINNHKSADTKAMNNISNYKKQNHAMEFFDFDLVKTRTKIKTLQKTGWFLCHHCLNDTLCNSWQGGCSKPRVETPPVNKKKII